MNDTEGMQLDPANLSEITINGAVVPMFEQFGRRWYQLITLFRALEFPEAGLGGLPTKIGNQFWNSGEFLKYKDTWYGTAKGLALYMDDLRIFQYSPTGSPKDKQAARVRQLILNQWLPSLGGSGGSTATAEGSANDTPLSVEAVAEESVSPDAVQDAEAAMCAAKSPIVPDGPVARAMMDNLLARVDSLCGVFGIDRNLPRDEKLVHVIWLLVFHGHDSVDALLRILNAANQSVSGDLRDAAEGIMEPEIFLLWCKQWSHVEDLVKAAMVA